MIDYNERLIRPLQFQTNFKKPSDMKFNNFIFQYIN